MSKYLVNQYTYVPIKKKHAEFIGNDINNQNSMKEIVNDIANGFEIYDKSILINDDAGVIIYILRKEI